MEAASKGVWQVWGTVGGAGQRQPPPPGHLHGQNTPWLGRCCGQHSGKLQGKGMWERVGHRSRGKLGMPVPMLPCFIEQSAL